MSEQVDVPPPITAPPQRSNRNLALLLIGAGVLIFIYTSGILTMALWSVVVPIALAAVGADLITERRQRRQIVIGAMIALAVSLPIVAGSRLINRPQSNAVADSSRSVGVGGVAEVDRVRARMELNGAELRVNALPPKSDSIAEVGPGGNLTSTRDGRTSVINVDRGNWENGEYTLQLTQQKPLDLSLALAAVDGDPLDLTQLKLEKLNLEVNAGSTKVRLPQTGMQDITISGTAGDVELDLPRDLPTRIEVDSTLSSIDVDGRFKQQGTAYVSAGYSESAPNRVTIRIKMTAGNVDVK